MELVIYESKYSKIEWNGMEDMEDIEWKIAFKKYHFKFFKGYLRYGTIFCHKRALDV